MRKVHWRLSLSVITQFESTLYHQARTSAEQIQAASININNCIAVL